MNDIRYQHINPEPLLEAVGGDVATCRHMFATFAQSAQGCFARLEEAIKGNESEQIRREAHSLKSSTALVGAAELTQLLKDIENKLKAEPGVDISAQLSRLQAMFAGVADEVQHYLEQVDASH